jgi:NADPH:quinone reductase-like Zn-dependent oxidoreductase
MKRDAVTPFRDKLWDLFQKQAKGMDGGDVVMALRQAGEEIWAVGIDDLQLHGVGVRCGGEQFRAIGCTDGDDERAGGPGRKMEV